MQALLIVLALFSGDDFQWKVSPGFRWKISEVSRADSNPVTLRQAIADYRKAGGTQAYVVGKTDARHLVEDHGWTYKQIRGLTLSEQKYLHGASHAGKIVPQDFTTAGVLVHTPPSRGEEKPARKTSPGADTKPALKITVADFNCPPCETVKTYDWSAFDVEWVTGGKVESGYPEMSWKDKDGKKRFLTGSQYTPDRVMWSLQRTQ